MAELEKNKKKRLKTGDFRILILTVAISLFGVIMDFSASYYVALSKFNDPFYYLKSAIEWFFIGWVLFILTALIDYHLYGVKLIAIAALVVGFGMLGALFTPLGVSFNNATRWIEIGPITLMPGEIIKTCFIIFFAWYFSDNPKRIHSVSGVAVSGVIAVAAFALIFKQPNLSTALIVVLMVAAMMVVAGLNGWVIAGGMGAMVVAAMGLFVVMREKFEYMIARITDFWDPFKDPLGNGYQVCQGLLAIGSGGFFGIGLGNSVQKAFYLPEPQSDFILAIIGEELGFFGILVLMIAYMALVYSIFSIGIRSKDKLGMYLASGVGIHLGLQVLLNIAVVTASAPATGVALPLVTLGGNSTALFMAELGIVYNISRKSAQLDEVKL